MRSMFKSLKFQLIMLVFLLTMILSGTVLVTMALSFQRIQATSTKVMENSLEERYDVLIKSQVQQAVSTLQTIYASYGPDQKEQAITVCRNVLRAMRYLDDKTGYFWADTYTGDTMVHGSTPAIEGKNRIEARDSKGFFLIEAIIKAGRQAEGGFTDYYFTKATDKTQQFPKRGYSLSIPELGWVIGTGNYIDEIKTFIGKYEGEMNKLYEESYYTAIIAVLAVLFIFSFSLILLNLRVFESVTNLTFALEGLTKVGADLTKRLPEKGPNELVQAARNYNEFVDGICGIFKSFVVDHQRIQSDSAEIFKNLENIEDRTNKLSNAMVPFIKNINTEKSSLTAVENSVKKIRSEVIAISDGLGNLRLASKKRNELLSAAVFEIRRFQIEPKFGQNQWN